MESGAMTEASLRKTLQDCCLQTKRCQNFQQLWTAIVGVVEARQALVSAQKDERRKELEAMAVFKSDLAAFQAWLQSSSQSGKFLGDAVEFKQAEGKGNGVFVKPGSTIEKDQVVMNIPLELCLFTRFPAASAGGANNSDLGIALPDVVMTNPLVNTVSAVELALALLQECKKGGSSFFAPYIAVLPHNFDTMPITWTVDELLLIAHDSNSAVILSRIADVCLSYSHLAQIPEIRTLMGTFEHFLWAMCIANSRQNPLPSKQGAMKKVALVPAYDMCNHDAFGTISTEFSWETRMFQCRAHKQFSAGDEFTIYYGPRPDIEFLLYSGYVCMPPGVNENSALILPFSIRVKDFPDLAKIKQVLVNGVPGINATRDHDFYLLQIGGSAREYSLRYFARAAAAKTKGEAQAALKRKLDQSMILTDAEREYVKQALKEHIAAFSTAPLLKDGCRPVAVRLANDLRLSNLAVLERTLQQCLQ